MNNKKQFEDTWLCAILVFIVFPAMIIIGNSGKDSFTFKEGLTFTLIVYLVNFTASLIYAVWGLPPKVNFKKRMDMLRPTFLISSFTITSPFILISAIINQYYRFIHRKEGL